MTRSFFLALALCIGLVGVPASAASAATDWEQRGGDIDGATAGDGFELDAISSVFIGGAAVQGGVGTVIGSMIGGMIQGVLANGMNLSSVGIDTQMTIKGLVLLLAVAFDVWSKNRK